MLISGFLQVRLNQMCLDRSVVFSCWNNIHLYALLFLLEGTMAVV